MPGTVGVSDLSVSRSASNGWGTATSGQVYAITTGTAAEFAVTAGVGTMTHNAVNTRHQVQLAWGTADWDETITVSSPVVATGSSIEADLVGRQVDASNYYYGGLFFGLSGAVSAVVGQRVGGTNTALATFNTAVTYAANTQIRLRAACVTQGAGVRLFVKVWLASTSEPTAWSGSFSQAFATVNSGGILGNGLIGVQSALSATNTNTLPVTLSFTNYQTNSVGVPYPLATEGVCADPTSNLSPHNVELAAEATVMDTYMTNVLDGLLSGATNRPYARISSNNQTVDPTVLSSVPFDTVEVNVGTATNLAVANGLLLGPGIWILEAEEIFPSVAGVSSATMKFPSAGGYTGPQGFTQVSFGQRAGPAVGSAAQLLGVLTVTTGTALVGLSISRTDFLTTMTYTQVAISAYQLGPAT